ncbi:MAG: rod-binding protein [Planctomycetes bacterium]|nr:rod-binding protein [Planctomycetota bacterium]
MLNAIDAYDGTGIGAVGTAFNKSRARAIADRADAIRLGRTVDTIEEVEKKVREVSEEFVSVFMNQVMQSMRATVPENSFMHGDNGERFFQEMLDAEQAKYLAKGSGYGLTDLIYESMMTSYRLQEQSAATAGGQAAASLAGTVAVGTVAPEPALVAGIR